jgi:peptidyl-prolyl cis-trans isomerase C
MLYHKNNRLVLMMVCLLFVAVIGCGAKEEKKESAATEPVQSGQASQQATPQAGAVTEPSSILPSGPAAVVIEVDGSRLTRGQVDAEINKKMAAVKNQIPKERIQQARTDMRKQVINDFVIRTLLVNEINRMKITASDKEVADAVERLKQSLPQGMTIEDLIKKNNITKEKMYDEIRLGVKVNKLVLAQKGGRVKPTDKEIKVFYEKNKSRFVIPEAVHVRHILIAKAAGDDDKIKTEKRAKADSLRKQLLAGADFAELAKNNSDCPSKNTGGDLGTFTRGDMVKPFEQAAFAQEKNAIGPVVETDFGFHIIQVLDRIAPKTMGLDEAMKTRISAHLQQIKQQKIFETMLKKLRAKANILVYQN